eukprot:m.183740 g.183740  ORF g.183740 m.183740 type:complete len:1296 (+) comp15548_c0_seq8:286-4173(+)
MSSNQTLEDGSNEKESEVDSEPPSNDSSRCSSATGVKTNHGQARKKKVSLFNASMLARQVLVKGHSNISDTVSQVRRYTHVAEAETSIKSEHIQTMQKKWKEAKGGLNEKQFIEVFREVLAAEWGQDRLEDACKHLFTMMDTNGDKEVDWGEFVEYITKGLIEKDTLEHEQENPVMVSTGKRATPHMQKIVRIVHLDDPPRFFTICERGIACIWNAQLEKISVVHLDKKEFGSVRSLLRVIDGAYIPTAAQVCAATNARDLRVYNANDGHCTIRVNFPEILQTMDFCGARGGSEDSYLALGDFKGAITLLTFHKLSQPLFSNLRARGVVEESKSNANFLSSQTGPARKKEQSTVILNWKDIPTKTSYDRRKKSGIEENKIVQPIVMLSRTLVHHGDIGAMNEACLRVKMIPDIDSVVSIASSSSRSMVVLDFKLMHERRFHIQGGVACVDYCERRKLLVTGGRGCIVHIWNPFIPNIPDAELAGHKHPIHHIQVNSGRSQVISCDANDTLKIWSITDHVCLNTFVKIIPRMPTPNTIQEFSSRFHDFLWHDQSQALLIASFTTLAVVELARDSASAVDGGMDYPVTSMCYVPLYNLIVTGDQGGNIASWDLATGARAMEYLNGHKEAAVTDLGVGFQGKRLISCGSDGDLLVWSILSGIVLQRLDATGAELTAFLYARSLHLIFAVGWGGRACGLDADHEVDVARAPILVRKDAGVSVMDMGSDDILCIDGIGDDIVAGGNAKGIIKLWDLRWKKESRKFSFETYRQLLVKQNTTRESKFRTAPSERNDLKEVPSHVLDDIFGHKLKPIRCIKWIKERLKSGDANLRAATLITSHDGGYLTFWAPVTGSVLGMFYVTDDQTESEYITCMQLDSQNLTLWTSDTSGWIKSFDISNYCTDGPDTTRLTAKKTWQAHHNAISSFYIHEDMGTVATASADCSIRLWHQDGKYIGSFGGIKLWDFRLPNSVSLSMPSKSKMQSILSVAAAAKNQKMHENTKQTEESTENSQTEAGDSSKVIEDDEKETKKTIENSTDTTNEKTPWEEEEKSENQDDRDMLVSEEDAAAIAASFQEGGRRSRRSSVAAAQALSSHITKLDQTSILDEIHESASLEEARKAPRISHVPSDFILDVPAPIWSRRSSGNNSTRPSWNRTSGMIAEVDEDRFGFLPSIHRGDSAPTSRQRRGHRKRSTSAPVMVSSRVLAKATNALEKSRLRESRLGSAYTNKARNWSTDRINKRQGSSISTRTQSMESEKTGMFLCTPFTALQLAETTSFQVRREPSCVVLEKASLNRVEGRRR